ncbi:hypothetical protein L3X38_028522 [Prunus dulcis]|uniref:Aminotransferase-like plant mobile domain-containing protein n=1 Tax=Prunus dulcis TaxID=3755 RepID=A0AAD4Z1C5_PRUDU|nr:hypothetical protein L3X38_028522 [Prunus dulcis]
MEVEKRLTPCSNGHDDEAEAENRSISELVSALRAASRSEDFGRVEEALAAREAKLKREIEKQRHENAVLEEMHEFERLERLKAEDELKQSMVKAEAVSEEKLPEEKDEGNEVIPELQRTNSELESSISRLEKGSKKLRRRSDENMQRRRSGRLASMDSATNNNGCASSAAVEGNGGLRISGYTRVAKMQMKRKNMKKKILGRKKKGKKKGGRTQEYAQYRCNMRSFFNTMQRIKERLTKGHLELLQQTPFWPLISAFYNGMISEDQCWKSESDIHNIISCYNSRTISFDFGSTSASLTAEDIAEILGLPQEGEEVELKGSRGYKSDFTERYFDVRLVSKKMVDAALEEALKGKRKTDAEDVVRLILIELCITFLLCNSNHMATWIVIQYCEDLENISRYSWAKVVVDILHRALKTKASQLKSCSVPGCVVVVMLWLCEKTNLIQPIKGREGHTPGLIKWSMRELHLKLKQIDVADIQLSFKKDKENKKKKEENKKTIEEAKSNGREEWEEGENVSDDTVGSLDYELRAQKTQKEFPPAATFSKRLNNDNEDLDKRFEDLWETIQNASAEVAKAQGKVNRLTEKLEIRKEKTKQLRRELKEEKKEKRKLKEDIVILNAEKKSLFESVKSVVKKLERTLEAEREEVKNIKKEKMQLINENQELKDQLNQGTPCTSTQLRADMQMEVSPFQSYLARLEKSFITRGLDPEFEYEQGGKKKRKVEHGKK